MRTADAASTLLLDVISRLGDVVGENGMRSLIHFAAAEVGGEYWAQMKPPRRLGVALAGLGDALGVRVEVVSSDERGILLRVDGAVGASPRIDHAREAIVSGFVHGVEQKRMGRAPDVRVEYAAPPLSIRRVVPREGTPSG